MTALRRTVQKRGIPIQRLDLQTICDKCSKLRQAEAVERRAREKV